MREPFRLRKPTKREAGLAASLAAGLYLANEVTQPNPSEPTEKADRTEGATYHKRPTEQAPDSLQTEKTNRDAAVPDHEEYREKMSDEVLERLANLDPNFSVTRTVSVNDQPVSDQFFGINYRMSDGNYRELGQVYPDENNGLLHLDPSEELRFWVHSRTGMELNSLSTSDADQLTDGATDLLELRDLMDKDQAGGNVSTAAIAEQLMRNETVTTEEAREEREENRAEAADTGN